MEKICIIFRGEHERDYIKYINSIDNYPNFKKYIFDDLQTKYTFDIVFVTYQTKILDSLTNIFLPKQVILCDEYRSQVDNFKYVNDFIQSNRDTYNRFVILRFDIVYKIKITEWPLWNQTGITVPNKDESYNQTFFCNDIVFVIDNTEEILNHFNNAVDYMMNINNMDIDKKISNHDAMPHHIGQYLTLNNISFNYMYDMCSKTIDNPLYIFQRYL